MANIINPEKPEIISEVKISNEKAGVLTAVVTINAAYQKEVYESIFKEKAKEVTVEGFRKGKAPREVVEPKIYSDVAQEMVNQILYIASAELITKLPKDYIVLDSSNVEKVDFKVVESPIVATFKVFYVKGAELPDLSKYKVSDKDFNLNVTDEEVEASIKQVFEQWKKQKQSQKASTDIKPEESKMDDNWVKQLAIPNVSNMKELKAYVKGVLSKEKQAKEKQVALEKVLDKLSNDLNIAIPKELVSKSVEKEIERQRKEVEKYGITLEKYLEYYKKDLNTLKQELAKQIEQDYKQEVLRQLYLRKFNIKLEKEDHAYMELAMGQLKVPPQALQDFNILNMIARLALVFKIYDDIAQKVGLGVVYKVLIPEHSHDHQHNHDHQAENVEKMSKEENGSSGKEGSKGKTGEASKILIADA